MTEYGQPWSLPIFKLAHAGQLQSLGALLVDERLVPKETMSLAVRRRGPRRRMGADRVLHAGHSHVRTGVRPVAVPKQERQRSHCGQGSRHEVHASGPVIELPGTLWRERALHAFARCVRRLHPPIRGLGTNVVSRRQARWYAASSGRRSQSIKANASWSFASSGLLTVTQYAQRRSRTDSPTCRCRWRWKRELHERDNF